MCDREALTHEDSSSRACGGRLLIAAGDSTRTRAITDDPSVAAVVNALSDDRAIGERSHACGRQCARRSGEARQRRRSAEGREPTHSDESPAKCAAECAERHARYE